MTIGDIRTLLDAEFHCGQENADRVVHCGCACDMMSDVLALVQNQAVLLTGLVNPQVQGGTLSDFTLWVNSQIDYAAVENIGEGVRTVVVEFVVSKDGSVREVNAIFGTHPTLNAEAIRIVKKSPKWTPAHLAGETRNVKLTVPVVFEF